MRAQAAGVDMDWVDMIYCCHPNEASCSSACFGSDKVKKLGEFRNINFVAKKKGQQKWTFVLDR